MSTEIVGSILHGAYGDLYEQALCLKHYAVANPGLELRLFAVTETRLDAFRSFDLGFASCLLLWTEIERQPEIGRFFQFQIQDDELKADVLANLAPGTLAKFDREQNCLPWTYMRENRLVPEREPLWLLLSSRGKIDLEQVATENGIQPQIWQGPTISFLWRYRKKGLGAISNFGQKSEPHLVEAYSRMFRNLIASYGCHILVFGMNIQTDDTNRARTDNKFPAFRLDLPVESVTYMKGLSWSLELELASRATVAVGHASGFTEALWLRRGGNMVLMDAPPHYLAKAAYHRSRLFNLNRPWVWLIAAFRRSAPSYGRRIAGILHHAASAR